MDETGIVLDYKPTDVIARKGVKYLQSRTSGKREMITDIATINAAGHAIPPHTIPKGKTARALASFETQHVPQGTNWTVSENGWTRQGIAKLWFTQTFLPNIGKDRPYHGRPYIPQLLRANRAGDKE